MIPAADRWKPMASAPRDGTLIVVVFHEFNDPKKPRRVAHAQFGFDQNGENWGWRKPYHTGTTQYADGWMWPQEFFACQHTAEIVKPAPVAEFDL